MYIDEDSHRKQSGYCNECAGDCQYDSDGVYVGEFVQDKRILVVRSRISGECHYEIFFWDEKRDEFITKKIWGDYDDAEAELEYLVGKGVEVFEYKELSIMR
jgi:hypothetical protein